MVCISRCEYLELTIQLSGARIVDICNSLFNDRHSALRLLATGHPSASIPLCDYSQLIIQVKAFRLAIINGCQLNYCHSPFRLFAIATLNIRLYFVRSLAICIFITWILRGDSLQQHI
jgi:hypothetical protein